MKIKYCFHKRVGDPKAVKLSTDDFLRHVAQESGATPAERKNFPTYLDIIASDGQYELDIPEDLGKEETARVKALYKAVEKAYKLSKEYEADMIEEAETQKKESEKRGQLIVVGAEKGRATAGAIASHMVKDVATAMKGKFVFDGMEMKLVKGAKPTEKDFSEVMGCLLSLKGAASNAADAAGFYLVDSIRLAKEAGFDGDQLIEQIAEAAGVEKFTAMQAQRLGEYWPPDKRLPGVSMTAHAEIMNYAGAVKDKKKLDEVIEKVRVGQVDEITTPDGKVIKTEPKPYSAGKIRKMMQEASGKTSTPKGAKGGAGGTESANFLYLTTDKDGIEVIFKHNDLSMAACESAEVTVLDLLTMSRLDSKGQAKWPIKDLDASWFSAPKPEPKKEKPAKLEKPKAEKPKAPEPKEGASVEIPD